MTDSRNLLENVDYAEGESQSITNFLEIECDKCGNKIKFKLAIGDIKNVEEYIEHLEKTVKTQQEEIERLRINNEILQGELDRIGVKTLKLEAGNSTDDVIVEIEKKDKIIDEMAKYLYEDDNIFGFGNLKEINTPEKIKEYFINKVEKERKDDSSCSNKN